MTGWRSIGGVEVFECRGSAERPRAVIVAGVHGDEYEGPAAAAELARTLDPARLTGSVTIVPVANPMAFAAGRRTTPEDGLNLARTFPGRRDGSPTERLAHAIFNEIVGDADSLIDLHSGGVEYVFQPMIGFYGEPVEGSPSFDAAARFGLPLRWQLPGTPGVLSREAWARDIVAVGAEYLGGGGLSHEGIAAYVRGVESCLAWWRMLRRPAPLAPGGRTIFGGWQLAECDGLFHATRALGEQVRPGDPVAHIADLRGEIAQVFTAPAAAMVAGLRSKAHIHRGDWGVFLAATERP